jgi:hypothetical protein
MIYNNDFKFDLEIGQVYEKQLGELLNMKVEAKLQDFLQQKHFITVIFYLIFIVYLLKQIN